jgi:pimeloyl-ACP methyl ester carboxylesterase
LKFIFVKPLHPHCKKSFAEAAAEKSKNEKLFQDMLIDDLELEGNLSKISQPTFILWGDTDRVVDVSSVSIFEKIRNHKKVIMKDCGHVPMIERPGETASLYLDFLKSSYLNRTK